MLAFTFIQTFLVLCLSVQSVIAAPINRQLRRRASDLSAPYFVTYNDIGASGEIGPPPAASVKGFNVVVLSFLLSKGDAVDKAKEWQSMSDAARSALKADYATSGIKLIVSAFGATETPTTSGVDPVQLAHTMSAWVKKYQLDGIDVDYEDLAAFNKGDGKGEQWLISFTKTLRADLPQGKYILSHAPLAPWFSSSFDKGGGYKKINAAAGKSIDFYSMQFYNQGEKEYTTCDSLLHKSTAFPKASVFEIAASGVPLDKIVIGKPAIASDATNGFMEPSLFASCLQEAKAAGWNGGAMTWQYPHGDAAWISSVKGSTFGSGGGGSSGASSPVSVGASHSPSPTGSGLATGTGPSAPGSPIQTGAAVPSATVSAVSAIPDGAGSLPTAGGVIPVPSVIPDASGNLPGAAANPPSGPVWSSRRALRRVRRQRLSNI